MTSASVIEGDPDLSGDVLLQEKKKQLRDELTRVNEARKALRNETRDMKQKLNSITNGCKVDEQV